MIDTASTARSADFFDIELRPNRSLTFGQLMTFYLALAVASITVAAFSASQGNVFAPVFAVLELSLLYVLLRLVWRSQGRAEHIALGGESLTIAWSPSGRQVAFNPYWVRIERLPGRTPSDAARLVLGSHGRRVEIGAFLAGSERDALERTLREALERWRASRVAD
jgi:uncharacterized membrane protein